MPTWHGKKLAGTHTTLIEVAQRLVKVAEKISEVEKISLGIIISTPGKKGMRRIKFSPITGGLLAKVRANTSIQEVRIYTGSPQKVQQLLEKIRL